MNVTQIVLGNGFPVLIPNITNCWICKTAQEWNEVSYWPIAHFLVPFTIYIFMQCFRELLGWIYIWESGEALVWWLFGNYVIFPGDVEDRESGVNSLIIDPMVGIFGLFTAMVFCYVVRVPSILRSHEVSREGKLSKRKRWLDMSFIVTLFTVPEGFRRGYYYYTFYALCLLVPFVVSNFKFVVAESVQLNGSLFIAVLYPVTLYLVYRLHLNDQQIRDNLWRSITTAHYTTIFATWATIAVVFIVSMQMQVIPSNIQAIIYGCITVVVLWSAKTLGLFPEFKVGKTLVQEFELPSTTK